MNKTFIIETLKKCETWKEGEKVVFRHDNWELILRKEELIYNPLTFSISGKKNGTNETISRRYLSAENAFLHVLNRFNENANIKNMYASLDEAMDNME